MTDRKIKALKPKDKPYKVSDFDGLYVNVTLGGSRLWRFKFRYEGKEGLLSFGRYPAISLQDARKMRDEARSLLAKGVNPSTKKAEEKAIAAGKAENSFNKFADLFVEKARKEGRADVTINKMRWLLDDARADFGEMPISEITPRIVLKTLRKREKLEQYETAKRMRSRIGGVFRYAVASGQADNDPTFALKDALIRPTVTHRAAITDEETLTQFLKALEGYGGRRMTVIALRLLMLFALRPSELRKARWEEFDFKEHVFNVPAERMKMRRPHAVPLTATALELLKELKDLTGWGDLLFPAQTSAHKPMSENTLNQALRRMGFGPDEATSHGFRSTFSTFANESGLWNPDAIEAYSSRQDTNSVRRAYNRSQYWEERVRIAEWWSQKLAVMTNG
ncbi:tyrosine-type recombinase/integrase [Litorimonas sp.]|uniref:tyrosine-type recombinase/integrase n=1 Tax=Litorimonas sp. TaxID=1892381 RepID=UPI003A88C11D